MPAPVITLYSKTVCGPCTAVKAWLKRRDLDYTEVNLEHDDDGAGGSNLEAAKSLGILQTPILFVSIDGIPGHEMIVTGFNPAALADIEKALAATP